MIVLEFGADLGRAVALIALWVFACAAIGFVGLAIAGWLIGSEGGE